MRAMLLSAGKGERMMPLTHTLPKPAVPVLGRPIALQILNRLARCGIERAVMNLHHLPEIVREAVSGGEDPGLPSLHFSHEEEILGTAGGIRHAAPLLRGDGPILICNGDFLSDIDVRAVEAAHRESGRMATLVLCAVREGYSTVDVDGQGRVVRLAGEPAVDPSHVAGSYLFTGCHVIDERVLDRIPADGPSDIVRDVYRPLATEGQLGSFLHGGFWWEFGTPELYLDGSMALIDLPESLRTRIAAHDPVQPLGSGVAALGAGAKFHETARIERRAALGLASYVSEGVRLNDAVVMPEAWIGPGCVLHRSIVARGVEIPAGLELDNQLVCKEPGPDAALPPSSRRADGLVFCPLRAADRAVR